MDWVSIPQHMASFFKKYRYVLLVLVIGVLLMAIPGKNQETESAVPEKDVVSQAKLAQDALEEILAQIYGVGKVRVLLTVNQGEKTMYQVNQDTTNSEQSELLRMDTVIITDSERSQQGLVQQVNPPQYLGAVIVCQGGGDASVRLSVVEAVSKATGLGADKISVLKMK